MLEKICIDCTECVKVKGVWSCHEMWDKPIAQLDECPLGIESEEIEEITQKAKENKINHHAKAENSEKKERKPKPKKVSDEKSALFTKVWDEISSEFGDSAQILKENKLIAVKIGDKSFKIDIIEQRKPKS